jgi:hypothetical protein
MKKTEIFIGKDSIEKLCIEFNVDDHDDGSVELHGGGIGFLVKTNDHKIMFDLKLGTVLDLKDMFNDLVDELEEEGLID